MYALTRRPFKAQSFASDLTCSRAKHALGFVQISSLDMGYDMVIAIPLMTMLPSADECSNLKRVCIAKLQTKSQ